MASKNTSGPAFPVQYSNESDGPTIMPTTGMTIRQYAAIKAMQGLLAKHGYIDAEYIARGAVKAADALLAELEK